MEKIMTFGPPDKPIQIFSTQHLAALAVIASFCLLLVLLRKNLINHRSRKAFKNLLAIFTALQQAALYVWYTAAGQWSLEITLPLQLCDLSIFLTVIVLFMNGEHGTKPRQYIFELLYFWGLGGATQALLTPDMGYFDFPHFIYYQFFLSHGLIIITALYMVLVEKFRPSLKSVVRVLIITNLYAAIMLPFNLMTGGNYLFLRYKPAGGSILDMLGPWPWYILSLEGVAVILYLLLYLPFAFAKKADTGRLKHYSKR
ncbi:MAG: TIGR02206 family membrane protein [Clostridiales bacterium]|nr:TIGR02206 family membrane protein [Clostridiales bacterium]